MSEPDDWAWSRAAAEILVRLGAPPVTVGALAALRYRSAPRLTTDADFLVLEEVPGIEDAFRARGYAVQTLRHPDGGAYLFMVRGGGDVRVDVIVAETQYQEEAYRRAVDGFLAPEDVIVHKLIAWRTRDQDDIRSILAAGHALDEPYIERWAGEWDVADRWSEARSWTV